MCKKQVTQRCRETVFIDIKKIYKWRFPPSCISTYNLLRYIKMVGWYFAFQMKMGPSLKTVHGGTNSHVLLI